MHSSRLLLEEPIRKVSRAMLLPLISTLIRHIKAPVNLVWSLEIKRKIEVLEVLQTMVKRLQSSEENVEADHRKEGKADIRQLAKDDSDSREMLSMFSLIPRLIGMLDSGDLDLHIAALYALLNLDIAVHKMLSLIESGNSPATADAIVANSLTISALDSDKLIIGSSGAISFLIQSFKNPNPSSPLEMCWLSSKRYCHPEN